MVLLCAFSDDNEEKMPVKPIANWTVFGKIQTATTTFIARLTRFRLISRPLENPLRIPTGRRGFITVPIPVGISTTHGSRVNAELDATADLGAEAAGVGADAGVEAGVALEHVAA